LFLTSSFVDQISFRIAMMGKTLGASAAVSGFDAASAIISIPLDLIFISIVRELTRKQLLGMTFGASEDGSRQISAAVAGGIGVDS
jgi:hypothetical protein